MSLMFGFADHGGGSEFGSAKPKRVPLTWNQKMQRLYAAPRTKLYLDMLSQVVLLVLMIILVIYEFDSKKTGRIEYVVYMWFGVLSLDKLWDAYRTGPMQWANDHWHYFELFQDTTFWLAVFFRSFGLYKKNHPAELPSQDPLTSFTAHAIARFIWGVTAVCLTVRLARFFYAAENLGPKVHMLGKIFADVKVFVAFLFLMALAAGLIFHVLIYPAGLPRDVLRANGGFSEFLHIAHRMFFRPAFMTFGELFIQDLHDESSCIGVEPFTSCSSASLSWVLPIMMMAYLMMAQIVLVNLLIAMMSTTYSLVEVEAYQVWNMSKADLLKEYKTKPALPQSPLSVFELTYKVVRFILRKGSERRHRWNRKTARDTSPQPVTSVDSDGTLFTRMTRLSTTWNTTVALGLTGSVPSTAVGSVSQRPVSAESTTDAMGRDHAGPTSVHDSSAAGPDPSNGRATPVSQSLGEMSHRMHGGDESSRQMGAIQQGVERIQHGVERQMSAILQESISLKTIDAFQEKNTERYLDKYKRMRESNSNVMSKLTEDHNYVRGVIHDLRTQLLYVERVAFSTFEEINNLKLSFKSALQEHSLATAASGSRRGSAASGSAAWTDDSPGKRESSGNKTDVAQLQIKMEHTQFVKRDKSSHSNSYPASPDRRFDHYGWKVAWRPSERSFILHASDPSQPAFLYAIDSIYSNADEVAPAPSRHRLQRMSTDRGSLRDLVGTSSEDDSSGEEVDRLPQPEEMVGDDELFVMYAAELPAFKATVGSHGTKEKELPAHLFNGDEVQRCELTPEQTDWGIEYKAYDPVYYVSPYVLFFGPSCPVVDDYKVFKWAHPEILQHAIDKNLLAASYHGDYMVDGKPRNPVRRTGIIGRGMLGHWGPNLARDQVITRWRRDDSMARIERKGRPLLEVLVCKKFSSDCWALPGALRRPNDLINPIVMRVLGIDDKDYNERNDVLKEIETTLISRSVVIYQGCTFDDRDTDNAWMESEVAHFHDDDNALGAIQIKDHGAGLVEGAAWAVVHEDLTLTANHREILNTIAHRLRAYW